jgi:hypothetical protein
MTEPRTAWRKASGEVPARRWKNLLKFVALGRRLWPVTPKAASYWLTSRGNTPEPPPNTGPVIVTYAEP